MNKIPFLLLLGTLLALSCKKTQDNAELPQASGRDIFANNAYVIDTLAISNVNSNSVEISKSKTALRPKIGDVILAAPTLSNPYGVLRRVTSVQETPTTTTMSTELASLDEAFKKITVDTIIYTPIETTSTFGTDASFGFSFNNNTSMFNGLKVDGTLKVNMPDIHFKISKGEGLSLNVIFEATLNTNGSNLGITNSSDNEIKLANERILKTISLTPFFIPMGGVPIPFFHEVKFKMLPVTVTGKASWNITPVVVATAGIKYENGWKNISSISVAGLSKPLKQSDFKPNIALNAELTLIKAEYALTPLNEKLLQLSFEIPTKLTFTAQPFQSPNYSLSLAASLGMKAETRFFFKSGAEVNFSTDLLSKKILEGDWNQPASVSIVSGNNQTDNPNATLSKPLIVEVKDIDGKPMPEVGVKWAVVSGGGQLSLDSSVTNAAGQAFTNWKLGSSGPQSVSAIVKKSNGTNVTGSPLTFVAITKEPNSVSIVSGNNQTDNPNATLNKPLIVEVKDIDGKPMPGIGIKWAVVSGGGQLTPDSSVTNAAGQATTSWKLGASGSQSVSAIVKKSNGSNVTGSPLTFVAVTKEPASIVIISGNNQNGFTNTNLSSPLVVEVKDATGSVMNGVPVSWNVNAGGGQVATVNITTDASGRASNTWKLGLSGTQTVTASVKKNDGSSLIATFNGVLNPISISSVSISDWIRIGSVCSPSFFQSGDSKVTVRFNTIPPSVGLIGIVHYWDNNGDGIYDGGGNGFTRDISTLQRNGNEVTLRVETCWGSKTTIVKIEVTYLGSRNSNTFSTIVPRP